MKNYWSLYNPVVVSFGTGCRTQLLKRLEGQKALVVTSERGRDQLQTDKILGSQMSSNRIIWDTSVTANPDLAHLSECALNFADAGITSVIGIGGGSAIDSAKALAAGITGAKSGLSLADLIGSPQRLAELPCIPLTAVPTTFGTGSEVTPFATVWDRAEKKKLSLTAQEVYPIQAIVDPDLGRSAPENVILYTGLDAFNQALESIWNRNANPITIMFATMAAKKIFNALPRILDNGDREYIDELALASLLAGLSISQTRTALCHSISYPITAHFDVPHGLACAYTMAAVCRLNQQVDDGRLARLAAELGGEQLDTLLDAFLARFNIRDRVEGYVGDLDRITTFSSEMYTPNRAGNNLNEVDETKIKSVLTDAGGLNR